MSEPPTQEELAAWKACAADDMSGIYKDTRLNKAAVLRLIDAYEALETRLERAEGLLGNIRNMATKAYLDLPSIRFICDDIVKRCDEFLAQESYQHQTGRK